MDQATHSETNQPDADEVRINAGTTFVVSEYDLALATQKQPTEGTVSEQPQTDQQVETDSKTVADESEPTEGL